MNHCFFQQERFWNIAFTGLGLVAASVVSNKIFPLDIGTRPAKTVMYYSPQNTDTRKFSSNIHRSDLEPHCGNTFLLLALI